jgi:hypothetical protein
LRWNKSKGCRRSGRTRLRWNKLEERRGRGRQIEMPGRYVEGSVGDEV